VAAVLLLHAWVESSACFDRLWQMVPPTLRVFAMDQRGHGDADKPADGYALVNFADDVEAFMDAVGLQSAVLLGSSSGGYVAQQVAVQVPHRVDGLVLVGAPRNLQGRPAFADEVDRLTDPVDPSWVEESLTGFPAITTCPTGTSRTGYATVCACRHTSGWLALRDSRPPCRRPSRGRSPRPH
jgi:rifampin ADP-ribosylating transferase